MLKYTPKTYSICKEGYIEKENEDAFILTYPDDDNTIRVALSDGATESSFAKEWAELLVQYFAIFDFENDTFFRLLHPSIKRQWLDKVNSTDLPWYAQAKLDMGAFATILGITISLNSGNCYVSAVGDSNIFIFRDRKLIIKFPVESSKDFGAAPYLLSSELRNNLRVDNTFTHKIFSVLPGDIFIAGTDAISQWILFQTENENPSIDYLLDAFTEKIDFTNWISQLRLKKEIKNDDTTLAIIKFE